MSSYISVSRSIRVSPSKVRWTQAIPRASYSPYMYMQRQIRSLHQSRGNGYAQVVNHHVIRFVDGQPVSQEAVPAAEQQQKPGVGVTPMFIPTVKGFTLQQALDKVASWRQRYIEDRYIFVPGAEMIQILEGLGGKQEDLPFIHTVGDRLTSDPTLEYRKTKQGRYSIDWETNKIKRLEFQPFLLSVDEDFNRFDSDRYRHFEENSDNDQANTMFRALMVFKSLVIKGVKVVKRPFFDYSKNSEVLTFFQVRTTTNKDMLGEPALEGVHTDGVDHTLTTLTDMKNMRDDSAITYMHQLNEKTGTHINEADPNLVRGAVQHTRFMDTLILCDGESKHSLSSIWQADTTKEASRDMFILFTRKPVVPGHVSSHVDSLTPHTEKVMELDLPA